MINRNEERYLYDNVDYEQVLKNGEPFEMLIIKDTDGNTYKKKIKTKHNQPFNLGDYITWNGQTWIITLLDPNDKTHHSGYMYLCTTAIHWQDKDGKIIERYVYVEDFTKYSSGIYSNGTITIGENQYGLTMPLDDDTKMLKRDMRFVIDVDGVDIPDVYKITNRKVVLDNDISFNRGGLITITMLFNAFNNEKDKQIDFNNKKIWICDYESENYTTFLDNDDNTTNTFITTISGKNEIKNGFARIYTVSFVDENGNELDNVNFHWKTESSFDIVREINGKDIKLFVDNENVIGNTFKLQVCDDNNTVIAEMEITVIEAF